MKRKLIGIVAALALATGGTFALVAYVQSAKDQAVAGEQLVEVYVVTETIAAHTPVSEIEGSLTTTEVPAKVKADGAVTDLEDLDDDLVTAVELEAGEQLLTSRLVDSNEIEKADVSPELQELTVALDPERAVGGAIAPGDTVGVLLSFDPFEAGDADAAAAAETEAAGAETELAGAEESTPDAGTDPGDAPPEATDTGDNQKTPNMTHHTFHKVLVTAVQFDQSEGEQIGIATDEAENDDEEAVERAPSNALLVTLAVSSGQAEQIVFAAEFGHIWLTSEGADADESGTRIVTLTEAYDPEVAS
jgi:pilus assembly protein CpaB